MVARCSGARHHLIIDAGDGLALNVETSGNGPAIVLLHGFTGSTETWHHLRSELEKSRQVVAIDLPGHGKSSSPMRPDRYGLNRLSDDLERVLDALEIDAAVIAGYSMGGRAALRFCLNKPLRVSGLILESTSAGIESSAEREQRVQSDEALAGLIEREGLEPFVDRWESLSIWETQKSLSLEVRLALRAQRLSGSATGLAASLRGAGAGVEEPVSSRLSEIAVPTLLIAGELDRKYVKIMSGMHKAIPASQLVVVERAGHAVHLERPDVFAAIVARFVQGLDSV